MKDDAKKIMDRCSSKLHECCADEPSCNHASEVKTRYDAACACSDTHTATCNPWGPS